MTSEEAERYLLGLELFGMRFGLERMHKLMTVLGLPQRRFASIHVVGTNGKSSVARFTAAILERHGRHTGSYTSPHLRSFRERIEVGEQPLSADDFASAVERAKEAAEAVNATQPADEGVTQFEALTAAAYHALAQRKVQVAVIEAGLGGRFDATNVIPSKVQVITSVGLEHTRWLGSTTREIAEEKLAVVRDHATLVVGELDPDARAVAERVAGEHSARLLEAPKEMAVEPAARGEFQRRNFALAATAAQAFLGRELDPAALTRAAAETRIPGRLELVGERPLTALDGAHNPAGARALAESLPELFGPRRPRVGVLAVLEDKDAEGLLAALLPQLDRLVLTRSHNPRSLAPGALKALVDGIGGPASESVEEPRAALERARELAGSDGAVLATGSIYLVADLVREPADAPASSL
ncbi:MAG TPA: folylpolyglutamate synthase/dihydrofolate synthase family protein [Thermoleophilaceae bacterium]|nr:folylpolyglutamate synthase/dihydrofolate synthase family protein [Thermoleophilaceae bacterium]